MSTSNPVTALATEAGLLDSHCHLDQEPLGSNLAQLLQDAETAGIHGFVVPGLHPDGWAKIAALASENHNIMPAYGIHPMYADLVDERTLERLDALSAQAVAIGEIGLDRSYPVAMVRQEQAFREQLHVAIKNGLPTLIHCRHAFQRTIEILREEGASQVGGIMHSFSGSPEMAREFIKLGFAISISGPVTWDNAVKSHRIARELPLEHLVLETDAPDMTPQRYKGAYNRPAWIVETAVKVAKLRGISLEEVMRATTDNVYRTLRLLTAGA